MSSFDRQTFKKKPRLPLRVSEHAMIRFRERVEEEFQCRDDTDLGDLLNERIRAATLSREVVDPRAPSIPTTLHLFESQTGKRLVAVVREKCVVTVLDDWMALNNFGGWEDEPKRAPLTVPLADKIRAIAIVPTTPAAPSQLPSAADKPAASSDLYTALAAECRLLGQRVRALREHRSDVDAEIETVLREFDEKREQLLALMNEGWSA